MADTSIKPRLLVITSTYPRWSGDTEPSFVHQLASRLTTRFDVVVSTSHAPGAKVIETMDGVLVLRYRYAPAGWESLVYGGGLVANLKEAPWKLLLVPSYLVAWAWQISQLKRRQRFDAIHAHWFIPAALVATFVKGSTPICVTAHGTDVLGLTGRPWRQLRRFIATRSTAITAVGKPVQDVLGSEGVTGVSLRPMGVDLSGTFVPPAQPRRSSRVLFVGRLVSSKRPEVALLALAEALKAAPQLGMDIIGDGPQRGHLEQLSEDLGIRSQVVFHGRRNQAEIASLFQQAAALICPSGGHAAPEGLGLVAVEALGCGCPVVSAPNAALQAAIPDTAPIHYAANDCPESICQVLLSVLQAPAPDATLATEWRKQLLETFDWPSISDSYGSLIEKLLPPR